MDPLSVVQVVRKIEEYGSQSGKTSAKVEIVNCGELEMST